jgi:ureidoacrylate peracid hydrolase
MHRIEISAEVLERIKGYRDGLHMFDNLDPTRTAHIIVDLQNGFVEPGATVELPVARDIVPNVNAICKAVCAAGAINVFIRYLIDEETQVNCQAGSWISLRRSAARLWSRRSVRIATVLHCGPV